MSLSRLSLIALSALASASLVAHADTFAGTASFQDTSNNNNGLTYTGTFASPSFSFSGGVNSTYTDRLTIVASQLNNFNAQDNISVQVNFTLPSSSQDTINGTGSNVYSFVGVFENNQINWNNNTSVINFSNGAQLTANLPDFDFGVFSSDSASGSEDLTFTVTKTAATPEPSSLALLGTGLVGACGAVRRRMTR